MKEQFKEFNNRKISDKVCDIHQVNYWEISVPVLGSSERKIQAFCPECVKVEIKQKEQDLLQQFEDRQAYFKTYDVLMRDSTIPNELKGATFDNFFVKTTEEHQMLEFVKGQVQKYLAGMTGNTLISGSTGIGKSHLSLALAKEINESFREKNEPKSVLFVSLTEIIKQGAKNGTISPKSDWEQDFLFDIINNRETTIFNTNLDSSELRTVYNARNSSRILKGLEGNTFKAFTIKDKRYTINTVRGECQ